MASCIFQVGTIENEYRVAQTEVIAGENDLETELIHLGCHLQLNYGEVYWNSRLEAEHERVVSLLQPFEVVCDAFCGIGPFAIPAARKHCKVYANDLNPDAVKWLERNAERNKVSNLVHAHNMSAYSFISTMADSPFHVCIMNLPTSATTFLPAFDGLCRSDAWADWSLPTIHCYTFAHGERCISEAEEEVRKQLGTQETFEPEAKQVRSVAPDKLMIRLTFVLPQDVALRSPRKIRAREREKAEEC